MFALFLTIAASQYVAAIVAHSVSLQADCVSMFVDAFSYLGNLAGECVRTRRLKVLVELSVSGLSLFLLAGFTIYFIVDAATRIHESGGDDQEDPVDPGIVLGFAVAGLVFDALSFLAYRVWGRRTRAENGTGHSDEHHQAPALSVSAMRPTPGGGVKASQPKAPPHAAPPKSTSAPAAAANRATRLNMLSALGHVLSDTLRSTTTLVEGIILLQTDPNLVDPERVDGWAALIVCSIIAVGTAAAIVSWGTAVHRTFFRGAPFFHAAAAVRAGQAVVDEEEEEEQPQQKVSGQANSRGTSSESVEIVVMSAAPPPNFDVVVQRAERFLEKKEAREHRCKNRCWPYGNPMYV